MELTRKQIILIVAISGLILLLTVGAVLIFDSKEEEAAPKPTATSPVTATPLLTPSPTPAPSPTDFRLPLVPQWDTPWPTDTPEGAGALVPQGMSPGDKDGPWVDTGSEQAKDILAVGLREGRAAALLLLRLSKDALTVLALPRDETALSGSGPKEQGEEAAALATSSTGLAWEGWMALDLSCLPELLAVTGPLSEAGTEAIWGDGPGALLWMNGALAYLRRASLLKFPAIKRAVGNSFASNLATRDLWSLFWAVRNGVAVRELALPAGER